MIRIDCEQGTQEWMDHRRGVATASRFSNILTPKGALSTQAVGYRYELLAEWLSGETDTGFVSPAMLRGVELEPSAVAWYEFLTDVKVDRVGFCFLDEVRLVGCSPDGLVGKDGGIEIKCPGGKAHMEFLLTGEVPSQYIPQVQGNMWVTGRQWWDFISYHDKLPPAKVRVARDHEYIGLMASAIDLFVDDYSRDRETLIEMGHQPPGVSRGA